MQRNYIFSTTFLLLLATIRLYSQDNGAHWQFNLQTKIADNNESYYNPDADTDHQRTFELGVDRMFNEKVGIGLSFESIDLRDKAGYVEGLSSGGGNTFSFKVEGDRMNNFKIIKLNPVFRFPFGRHALSLRPGIGATFLQSSQNVTYASVNNGVAKTETEDHNYNGQTLLYLGGNVEYSVRLVKNWSVFVNVGYAKISSDKKRHIFESSAALSDYTPSAYSIINEIRLSEMHTTGNFEFTQLGIGVRYRMGH